MKSIIFILIIPLTVVSQNKIGFYGTVFEAGIHSKTAPTTGQFLHGFEATEDYMGIGGFWSGTIGLDFGKIDFGIEVMSGSYSFNKKAFRDRWNSQFANQELSTSYSYSYFKDHSEHSKNLFSIYFPITYELEIGPLNAYPSAGFILRSVSYADIHYVLKPYNSNRTTEHLTRTKGKLMPGIGIGFDLMLKNVQPLMLKQRLTFANSLNEFTYSEVDYLGNQTTSNQTHSQPYLIYSIGLSLMIRSDMEEYYGERK